MQVEEVIERSLELIKNSRVALVGTIGNDGYPYIKAMFIAKKHGFEIWFSTNTSSKRITHIKRDNKVCLYFLDEENIAGLMLLGKMNIKQDLESRTMLWEEGDERYYSLGINDPDYTVLHFIAEMGNFYHRLQKLTFPIKEII